MTAKSITSNRNIIMNPEDQTIIDFRSSCTKDEAVAKLLGWSRGHIFPKNIKLTVFGIAAEDLKNVPSNEYAVNEQLQGLLEAARHKLIDAAENGATHEALWELEDEVRKRKDLITRAIAYFIDIDSELSKGMASAIRPDAEATAGSGVLHLTLGSLDEWAKQKYGFSILETVPTQVEESPISNLNSSASVAEDDKASDKVPDSFYYTMALMSEFIARRMAGKFAHPDKSPNISGLSTALLELALEIDPKSVLKGQGDQMIRKRLTKARDAMALRLRRG